MENEYSSDPDDGGVNTTYVGILISILGNVCIACALNIQKYSHNKNASASETNKRSYLKRPIWWAGMLLMLFGELGNFLAYAFAPASVIAPLGTVALVTNAIIAPFVLKEKFRPQDLIGILVAIVGALLVVIFASAEDSVLTPDDLLEALSQVQFLVYLSICIVAIVIFMFLSVKYGHRTILIDIFLVGIFGGYTVVATKAVASLLGQGIFKMFTYWIFYIMFLVMISTGVLQIRYLQKALERFDSTAVIPAQFVFFTVFAIVSSGILYNDFEHMSGLQIGMFCLGCLLTFVGVFLITSGRPKADYQPVPATSPSPAIVEEETVEEPFDTVPLKGDGDVEDQGFYAERARSISAVGHVKELSEAVGSYILAGIRSRQEIVNLQSDLIYQHYQADQPDEYLMSSTRNDQHRNSYGTTPGSIHSGSSSADTRRRSSPSSSSQFASSPSSYQDYNLNTTAVEKEKNDDINPQSPNPDEQYQVDLSETEQLGSSDESNKNY